MVLTSEVVELLSSDVVEAVALEDVVVLDPGITTPESPLVSSGRPSLTDERRVQVAVVGLNVKAAHPSVAPHSSRHSPKDSELEPVSRGVPSTGIPHCKLKFLSPLLTSPLLLLLSESQDWSVGTGVAAEEVEADVDEESLEVESVTVLVAESVAEAVSVVESEVDSVAESVEVLSAEVLSGELASVEVLSVEVLPLESLSVEVLSTEVVASTGSSVTVTVSGTVMTTVEGIPEIAD